MNNKLSNDLNDEEELMAHVNEYKGLRLKIFSYFLLKPSKGVSTNEIKNVFRLKSASHASYHLTLMYQNNVLIRDPRNHYHLNKKLQVSSIKMNTLVEYFVFNNRLWPRSILFKIYITITLAAVLALLAVDRIVTSEIFTAISLVITAIFLVVDYRTGNKWLHQNDDNADLYPKN